jgi:hypothetical protein
MPKGPIIYVRGYAGTQGDVEETVDDPFYGFNLGSTHIRVDVEGAVDFYAFESPFVRLLTDHKYECVFDGTREEISENIDDPDRTIWIYRYYDPTSKTFEKPGGRRLTIEESAAGLRDWINDIRQQVETARAKRGGANGKPKVMLVAHSMGGLVCRSLIQKIYPENGEKAGDFVEKFFTYGTPHRGISFALGAGVIERLRDYLGVNDSNDFGPQRMFEYLTPGVKAGTQKAPGDYYERSANVMPDGIFDLDRVFCVVGTNARDYEVARGLSRTLVGPQSDGLVQMDNAWVQSANRAYIYRSHSGRYGMVNSEEAYQNLRRFLFGDIRVKTVLSDFELDYSGTQGDTCVTYQFECQASIRGLPILMHDRTVAHFCPISLDKDEFTQRKQHGLPLYTSFLITAHAKHNAARYMLYLSLYRQTYRKGFLQLSEHVERLPLWSDYVVIDIPLADNAPPKYSWLSNSRDPNTPMTSHPNGKETDYIVPLPDRARASLGDNAKITFETSDWG